MVTVRQMRDMLAPNTNLSSGRFKHHPLMLPAHEKSDALVDYSVLSVSMPFVLGRGPKTETSQMLRPLARLCREHRVKEGEWSYKWYYLELLDREDKLHPLCWISTELLARFFPDEDLLGALSERDRLRGRWPRRLEVMDLLPQIQGSSPEEREVYAEWQEWFVRTWQERQSEWRKQGLLITRSVSPWTSMIGFEPKLAALMARTQNTGWDAESDLPMWLTHWKAGYSGFYWRMVPLFDIDDAGIVWEEMKRQLFLTSVFNITAGPHQDPELWAQLEERFKHPFQKTSRYRYYIGYREQRVLELSRQGYKLDEIAEHLLNEGFFPFNRSGPTRAKRLSPEERAEQIPLARRVVVRIRTRLIRDGAIEPRKRGRPPKNKTAPEESSGAARR
jgi:hypothetical protein